MEHDGKATKCDTPLIWAIRVPDVDMVRLLVSKGADVNKKIKYLDDEEATALSTAKGKLPYSTDETVKNKLHEIIKILEKAGAK